MSWNHRVVVTEDGAHQVAEVFYEEDGTPRSWGMVVKMIEIEDEDDKVGPEALYKSLLWSARESIKAFYKPVLYVRNGELTEVKGA